MTTVKQGDVYIVTYHGGLDEAMRITERLAEGTGHRFSLRMWPQ